MSRLRVLHVMTRMAPAGTERQLAGMLRAAHGALWDAQLVVLHPGWPLADELARDLPVTQLPYGSAFDPRRPAALRALAAGADVVHSSLWGANALTRLSLLGPGRPTVVVSERRVEDFRPAWTRLLDRRLRALTDGYVGNSNDVVRFVQRAHGVTADRVHLVRNGIDLSVFSPRPADRPERAGLRIGGVGRLVPEKGFDVAIAALAQIRAVRPDAELVLAGQGPQRGRLEAAAQGLPVTFAGQLATPSAVAGFLRGLDVFVLPSHVEGLPNVVLEALACGVPVVATDAPGTAEAADGRAALVPPGDSAALAAAVLGAATGRAGAPGGAVQSFRDVAEQHLSAFEAARERRHARAGTSAGAPR